VRNALNVEAVYYGDDNSQTNCRIDGTLGGKDWARPTRRKPVSSRGHRRVLVVGIIEARCYECLDGMKVFASCTYSWYRKRWNARQTLGVALPGVVADISCSASPWLSDHVSMVVFYLSSQSGCVLYLMAYWKA
jgi:hypothetical protein